MDQWAGDYAAIAGVVDGEPDHARTHFGARFLISADGVYTILWNGT